MSDTITRIDAAKELASWTRRLGGMYAKDLKAISDEAYTQNCGGCARTVHDFTAECVGITNLIAQVVRGETPSQQGEEIAAEFKESLNTREKGIQGILASSEALASAIEQNTDKLGNMTQAPWGEPLSVYNLANIGANHIMYHDGQLNYIQSINGDGAVHWMDE